jgi:3',5'-nucleoside bisphosphate phosphatase
MNTIDLHCHSTYSDGDYTPSHLLEMARQKAIRVFSLTDHDAVGGLPEAEGAAKREGVAFITGTEISIEYATGTFHLLGYGIDYREPGLMRLLHGNQDSRETRAQEWINRMQVRGLDVSLPELAGLAGGQLAALTKLHAAQLLMKKGVVVAKDDAFAAGGPLSPGGWLDVDRKHANPEQGISAIKNAGGKSIVAHPYTL